MRFGIDMNTDHTLEEVGKQFDVTRERIRQIEAKACASCATRLAPITCAASSTRVNLSASKRLQGGRAEFPCEETLLCPFFCPDDLMSGKG